MRKPVLARAGSAPPARGRDAALMQVATNGDGRPTENPTREDNRSGGGSSSSNDDNKHPRGAAVADDTVSTLPVVSRHAPPSSASANKHSKQTKRGKRRTKRQMRICRRHPYFDASCVAQSRTESVLVSSSGDVLVCRCRRSSTPYIDSSHNANVIDDWTVSLMPCCKTSDVCGVGIDQDGWSPVFAAVSPTRMSSGSASQRRPADQIAATVSDGYSTYEWEAPRMRVGLLGGGMPQTLAQTSTAPDESTQVSYAPKDYLHNDYTDQEFAGLMPPPSFDYNGFENDMVEFPDDDDDGHERRDSSAATVKPNNKTRLSDTKNRRDSQRGSIRNTRSAPLSAVMEHHDRHEEKKDDALSAVIDIEPPTFLHGVPTFLSALSQIQITKVSAHPLGAHVLMISEEAILFTYGLNQHGQLGIGVKSHLKDGKRGFITEPTIVTPLLENGGKTIQCAAGVNHSLVVVETEGRRLHKVRRDGQTPESRSEAHISFQRVTSSPSKLNMNDDDSEEGDSSRQSEEELVLHHQVYGFGNNSFMKLGLVSASNDEDDPGDATETSSRDVLLPRRVALHSTVWPDSGSRRISASSHPLRPLSSSAHGHHEPLPRGIFDLSASTEHSAALVRRASGDVEVYVWGNATVGALGLPLDDSDGSVRSDANRSNQKGQPNRKPGTKSKNIFPIPTVVESLSYRPRRDTRLEYPVEMSLGPYCSFVVFSSGRCKAFGYSQEGMLGHAFGYSHTMQPKEVFLPPEPGESKRPGIVSISAGAYHVIAVVEDGRAYSWGINLNHRLGLGSRPNDIGTRVDAPGLSSVEWVPQEIKLDHPSLIKLNDGTNGCRPPRIIRACAGYDSSILILENGQALSFGKGSGRVGLGEAQQDVRTPSPMYGGLRLFAERKPKQKGPPKRETKLVRQSSAPVFTGQMKSADI